MRYIVIPDIHGDYDALCAMLRHCGAVDARLAPRKFDGTLVQLGDLVDRGPKPKACVELMMKVAKAAKGPVVALLGNHEDLLMESAHRTSARATWLMNGGSATLKDYGEAGLPLIEPGGAHYAWMRERPTRFEAEGVFFCHGGITKANLKDLDPQRLLWDRPPLVRGPYRALVCGHTPTGSGRVEHADGVFRCDIGLGYGPKTTLEYLTLEPTATGVDWQIETL